VAAAALTAAALAAEAVRAECTVQETASVAWAAGSEEPRRGKGWPCGPCARDGERVRPFIFVYDTGEQYTEQVKEKAPAWYSEVYDAEKVFLEVRAQAAPKQKSRRVVTDNCTVHVKSQKYSSKQEYSKLKCK